MASWIDLPIEIKSLILTEKVCNGSLSVVKNSRRLELVSKEFRKIIRNLEPSVYNDLQFKFTGKNPFEIRTLPSNESFSGSWLDYRLIEVNKTDALVSNDGVYEDNRVKYYISTKYLISLDRKFVLRVYDTSPPVSPIAEIKLGDVFGYILHTLSSIVIKITEIGTIIYDGMKGPHDPSYLLDMETFKIRQLTNEFRNFSEARWNWSYINYYGAYKTLKENNFYTNLIFLRWSDFKDSEKPEISQKSTILCPINIIDYTTLNKSRCEVLCGVSGDSRYTSSSKYKISCSIDDILVLTKCNKSILFDINNWKRIITVKKSVKGITKKKDNTGYILWV